jgi:hypothetical protein
MGHGVNDQLPMINEWTGGTGEWLNGKRVKGLEANPTASALAVA